MIYLSVPGKKLKASAVNKCQAPPSTKSVQSCECQDYVRFPSS
mgnify:CR=1 FL=1